MSEPLGSFTFLPWLRRGVATQIRRVDGAGPTAPRAAISFQLGFNSDAFSAAVDLNLFGPGEVTGFDERVIIRTWPRPDVFDAEANFFPLVEFEQADLPWRYTPARATVQDRLRPWICLIVLKDDEIESFTPARSNQILPVVRVSAAFLPMLSQSWAWAHVQVSGRNTITEEEAAALLATTPHALLSRLLCPRRMDPRTMYTACIVPTFERGRLAGLGQPMPDSIDGLAPAWTDEQVDEQATIDLPIYYRWRFQTGAAGDFESLVRRLRARAMPPTVGIRPMDVSNPGASLPAAAETPLGLEGALKSPATESTNWNPVERGGFIAALQTLVNQPAEMLTNPSTARAVAPPLYGHWHAARDTLNPAEPPPWFQELNSDPRLRTTAGLGTLVVQDQQEKLMASAWQQVDRIREINEKLRLAQLARESAIRIHLRHLAVDDMESVLEVGGPVLGRVFGSPVTVQKLIEESPIAKGVMEAQFRRVSRPLGPIGRRQGRPELPRRLNLLDRMNRGQLSPATPPPTPEKMATPKRVGANLLPKWATPERLRLLRALPRWLLIAAVVLLVLALIFISLGLTGAALIAGIFMLAAGVGSVLVRRKSTDLDRRAALRDGKVTPELIQNVPPRPDFIATERLPGSPPAPLALHPSRGGGVAPSLPIVNLLTPAPSAPSSPAGSGGDSPSALAFRQAATALSQHLNTPVAPGRILKPINITQLGEKVILALDPRVTIAESVRRRLILSSGLVWEPEDPLEPIMAAPEFPQPMYEPLRDLSQDWLLPGLDQVPADTVSLLLTNQKVVEAYMVGLNHEIGRELLWREFPTDQRGSYCRQFWDTRGYVTSVGETFDPESYKDIKLIHTWRRTNSIGRNTARRPPPGGEHLVLLVRGELLRRYPNTLVYAVKARRGSDGLRELTDEEKHPVFRGTLKPDVTFFGFELTPPEVRGTRGPNGNQGWFFVLQEQPSEPRFGLDVAEPFPDPNVLTSWSDFSWEHLAPDQRQLEEIVYIDLTTELPNVSLRSGEPNVVWHADAGTRASELAFITLQVPVRIAVHGSDMLPPEERR